MRDIQRSAAITNVLPRTMLESHLWMRADVKEAKCFVQPHAAFVRQHDPA
ncbi:hypothetical protein ALO41_102977 [Pseudomonas amygdali pv. ulmi]|jgi:hypothetical protein|uniref:Uncharacterized protein n=1 Tax=Pseudomonas amygdali pv. ulmi TaxID=251720 RepID=A0A0N8TAF5_PSEA0|nr:hypothetical protein ALO86_102384 [Pseudomonas syringae pv. berberidis]KPZ05049.1 hypothetical protein ALO41_102977 [Pseudomonas amygdali pv. ulmi]RMQ34762.1 hypothetical protein ALQ06_102623 [Pseudomonas syringae pv. berberidis]